MFSVKASVGDQRILGYQAAKKLRVPVCLDLQGDEIVEVGRALRDGEEIVECDYPSRNVTVRKTLLGQFVELASAEPAALLDFARRWGLLGLCEHNLPAGHNQRPRSITPEIYFNLTSVLFCAPKGRESVEVWRMYARYFGCVTNIAAGLHDGQLAGDDQWEVVRPSDVSPDTWRAYHGRTHTIQRRALAAVVNACADAAGLLPVLSWTKAKPELEIGGRFAETLFAVLAEQLILAVSQSEMAICSHCRSVYLPQRKPKTGQNNYCPRCRAANIPVILALRAGRERERGVSSGKAKTRSK